MATKKVGLLVGLMGGSLYVKNPYIGQSPLFWVDVPNILTHGFNPMTLASDGVSAHPTYGQELVAGGPDDRILGGYYEAAVVSLRRDAPDNSWDVVALPYDWRKSCLAQGQQVAGNIVNDVENNGVESYTLACHSQGGIIARVAWLTLKAQGKQQYIRRIVTVGTPHYGTWAVFASILGFSNQIKDFASYVVRGMFPRPLPFGSTVGQWLGNIAATFPSFWELFPQLNAPSASFDEQKSLPYNSRLYPLWLQFPILPFGGPQSFQATLNDPANIPPPDVMFCVWGSGVGTLYGVGTNKDGSFRDFFESNGDGDETVLAVDQYLADHDSFHVRGWKHSDMMKLAGLSGLLSWACYEWEHGGSGPPGSFAAGVTPSVSGQWPPWNAPFATIKGTPTQVVNKFGSWSIDP